VVHISVDPQTTAQLRQLHAAMQGDLQKAIEQVHAQSQLDLKPLAQRWTQAQEQIRSQLAETMQAWDRIWLCLGEEVRASWAPYLDSLSEHLETIPPRLQRMLIALGNAGWFLDPKLSLPELWSLEAALESGDFVAVDAALDGHFDHRREPILEMLLERHPSRTRILKSAFEAHARGEYELSIPVLLAQADGICQDFTKRQLFKTSDKIPELARHDFDWPRSSATLHLATLQPLLTGRLPISASAKDRDSIRPMLNRHQVLHGESTDYGTRTNGLRAISFINYVSYVLEPRT
jgi:hypothetical protein